jgi:hypothetical protein
VDPYRDGSISGHGSAGTIKLQYVGIIVERGLRVARGAEPDLEYHGDGTFFFATVALEDPGGHVQWAAPGLVRQELMRDYGW